MSQVNQEDVWALELSNYFIKHHKYQLMTLNKETQEMWLIQPSHDTYPIIMISTLRTDEFNHEELNMHRQGIAMLLKSKAEGINISVNKESEFHDLKNVIITDDIISSDSITKDFKGLNKVLKPTSNFTNAMHKVAGSIQRNMIKIQKREALKATMVTNILFAILGIVFGISYFMTVKFEMNYTEVLLRMGAYYKPLIVEFNQYWRLITPMFLHGDFIHLFMNTLAMRNLGTILEKELGPLRYLMTILSGVLFGSVFLFIKNDPAIGVGISSGIYALLGVLLVYLFEKNLYKNRMILMNITTTILLNLYISLMPNVSMTAHLGGLYVGVILGFIFSKRKDWDQIRKFAQLILVTSIAFLGLLMVQNINIL